MSKIATIQKSLVVSLLSYHAKTTTEMWKGYKRVCLQNWGYIIKNNTGTRVHFLKVSFDTILHVKARRICFLPYQKAIS